MKSDFRLRLVVIVTIIPILFAMVSCSVSREQWRPVVTLEDTYTGYPPVSETEDYSPIRNPDQSEHAVDSKNSVFPESLSVTIDQAVLLALENNRALKIEQLKPGIMNTYIEQERSVFDPGLTGQVALNEKTAAMDGVESSSNIGTSEILLKEYFPSGTSLEAGMSVSRDKEAQSLYTTGTTLTATQALLQDRGFAVNRVMIRQAYIDSAISDFELRGFAEALVSEVEDTYWEFVLAQRQVAIVEESLRLVNQEMDETMQRIRVGTMAETELVAVEAEHALQLEALINANSDTAILQVKLLRLINPEMLASAERKVIALSEPSVPPSPVEPLENHLAVAFRLRPDLNEAELLVQRGDVELVKTRNGLLPKLDLFVLLGKTGYADSFRESLKTGENGLESLEVGLSFDASIFNRAARARHDRAFLSQQQLQISMANLKDLVQQDVELACIEVNRTRQQVDATASTRRLQKEKLRVETARFHAGKTTGFFVAQAHRDLLVSEVAEVKAVINYIKARNHLFLMEGSLLARRGFDSSDITPVYPE